MLEGFHLDVGAFTRAELITLWQDNGNIVSYIAATHPDQTTRVKLVSSRVQLPTSRSLTTFP